MKFSVCTVLLSLVLNVGGNLPYGAGHARNGFQDNLSGKTLSRQSDDQTEYGGTYSKRYSYNNGHAQDGGGPGLEQRVGSYGRGCASGKNKGRRGGLQGGEQEQLTGIPQQLNLPGHRHPSGGAEEMGGLQEQLSGLLQNLGPQLQALMSGGGGGALQEQLSGLLQNLGPQLQGLMSGSSGGALQGQLSGLLQNLGPLLQGLTSGGSGGKGGALQGGLQGQLSGLLQNLGPLMQGLMSGGSGGKGGGLQGLLQNLGPLGQGLSSGGSAGKGGSSRHGQRSGSQRQGLTSGGSETRGRKGYPRGGYQDDDVMGQRKRGK